MYIPAIHCLHSFRAEVVREISMSGLLEMVAHTTTHVLLMALHPVSTPSVLARLIRMDDRQTMMKTAQERWW